MVKKHSLLKKNEILLWENLKNKLNYKNKDLNDYSDFRTVEIIKSYIHHPIWIPAGLNK